MQNVPKYRANTGCQPNTDTDVGQQDNANASCQRKAYIHNIGPNWVNEIVPIAQWETNIDPIHACRSGYNVQSWTQYIFYMLARCAIA